MVGLSPIVNYPRELNYMTTTSNKTKVVPFEKHIEKYVYKRIGNKYIGLFWWEKVSSKKVSDILVIETDGREFDKIILNGRELN